MAPGDGPDDVSTSSPGGEPPDAQPSSFRGVDPAVEGVWLHHRPPARSGLPRFSTILLALAFVGLLVLWLFVH
ncbi:hypothetical protein [Nocardia sp. NPDC049149]|uniref:hypothetical protein n=1 Tax=Nocardia sp. NPDC049149 TaxID=3364315 RepID=UPI003721F8C8